MPVGADVLLNRHGEGHAGSHRIAVGDQPRMHFGELVDLLGGGGKRKAEDGE
jgi:hypothetical protein